MKKLLAILLLFSSPALAAGEFGSASQQLEGRVDFLYQEIDRLESMIENLGGTDPGPEPVECLVTSVEPGQDPLFNNQLPGRIEAEDYDLGVQGVAYFDTTPENVGSMYRADGVDIKATGDESGQFQVGWIADGEWLEYTVCAEVGMYEVIFRVTADTENPGSTRVLIDGEVVGQFQTPNTGSWDDNYVNVTLTQVPVRAGNQIIRLEFLGGPHDINWFEFKKTFDRINRAPTGILLCKALPDGSPDLDNCDTGETG